jgi:hypothetical protein
MLVDLIDSAAAIPKFCPSDKALIALRFRDLLIISEPAVLSVAGPVMIEGSIL